MAGGGAAAIIGAVAAVLAAGVSVATSLEQGRRAKSEAEDYNAFLIRQEERNKQLYQSDLSARMKESEKRKKAMIASGSKSGFKITGEDSISWAIDEETTNAEEDAKTLLNNYEWAKEGRAYEGSKIISQGERAYAGGWASAAGAGLQGASKASSYFIK